MCSITTMRTWKFHFQSASILPQKDFPQYGKKKAIVTETHAEWLYIAKYGKNSKDVYFYSCYLIDHG